MRKPTKKSARRKTTRLDRAWTRQSGELEDELKGQKREREKAELIL